MPDITAEMVKRLREETNVSMMECKRALTESGGDLAKATTILRKRGIAIAAHKASRAANQGAIGSANKDNGRIVSLVEVNCETDFVAKNASFGKFVGQLAEQACESDSELAQAAKDLVVTKITETGENIVIRRNIRYVLSGTGAIASQLPAFALYSSGFWSAQTFTASAIASTSVDISIGARPVLHAAAAARRITRIAPAPTDIGRRDCHASRRTHARLTAAAA